jgi:hypothetical protein
MPIATNLQVANVIFDITNSPSSSLDVAESWSNVADILGSNVLPVSTTAKQAKAAMKNILLGLTSDEPTGILILKNAFKLYGITLALGMNGGGYLGIPPVLPPMFETVLIGPSTNAELQANLLASILVVWIKTGTAVLIAPPNTFTLWV